MNNNVTRRTFLKGSVATAVIAAVSGCASQVKGKQDTYLTGLIARMTMEEKAGHCIWTVCCLPVWCSRISRRLIRSRLTSHRSRRQTY